LENHGSGRGKTSKVRLLEEAGIGDRGAFEVLDVDQAVAVRVARASLDCWDSSHSQFPRVVDPVEIVVLEKRGWRLRRRKIKRGRTLRAAEDLEVRYRGERVRDEAQLVRDELPSR